MPFVVRHGLLGYLTRARRGDQEGIADDNDRYGEGKGEAVRFKTRELAEEAAGPLLDLCEIERVKK